MPWNSFVLQHWAESGWIWCSHAQLHVFPHSVGFSETPIHLELVLKGLPALYEVFVFIVIIGVIIILCWLWEPRALFWCKAFSVKSLEMVSLSNQPIRGNPQWKVIHYILLGEIQLIWTQFRISVTVYVVLQYLHIDTN